MDVFNGEVTNNSAIINALNAGTTVDNLNKMQFKDEVLHRDIHQKQIRDK